MSTESTPTVIVASVGRSNNTHTIDTQANVTACGIDVAGKKLTEVAYDRADWRYSPVCLRCTGRR